MERDPLVDSAIRTLDVRGVAPVVGRLAGYGRAVESGGPKSCSATHPMSISDSELRGKHFQGGFSCG